MSSNGLILPFWSLSSWWGLRHSGHYRLVLYGSYSGREKFEASWDNSCHCCHGHTKCFRTVKVGDARHSLTCFLGEVNGCAGMSPRLLQPFILSYQVCPQQCVWWGHHCGCYGQCGSSPPGLAGTSWTRHYLHQDSLLDSDPVQQMCLPGCWHACECAKHTLTCVECAWFHIFTMHCRHIFIRFPIFAITLF